MLLHSKIILAIVDDHPVVIEGIKNLLALEQSLFTVSFTTGRDFLIYLKNNEVNIVLLDVILPDANGLELCKEIKKIAPATVVLALSNQAERSIILQMVQNGASGYLLKNVSAQELIHCIDRAMAGDIVFSKEAREIINHPSQNEWKSIPTLTKREKEILKLIADGFSSSDIADKLFLSSLTIETHRRNIIQKFQTNNMFSVIKLALEHKII